MNALAREIDKRLHWTLAPELRSEALVSACPVNDSAAAVNLLPPDSTQSEHVPPKVAQAIAAMRGEVRSTFIFLQILVLVVMVGSAALHFNILQERFVWLPFVALLGIFGGLLFLPVRLIASDWFPGLLAILDTIISITAALFYYSGRAGTDAYVAYFLIMIIALITRTRRQTILCARGHDHVRVGLLPGC
jgi:hypothetical protein